MLGGLFRLLNRAARYFPILRELRKSIDIDGNYSILEIGSGAIGLGQFYRSSFVGCDLEFTEMPRSPMRAVRCSGTKLPFGDKSFDGVVLSDVMEHVPPDLRPSVISEALRVSRRVAIFGFPCGRGAFDVDKELHARYLARKAEPPVWLKEHMLHLFPDATLFSGLPPGWKLATFPNESVAFHSWMMRLETYRLVDYFFRVCLILTPWLVEPLLRMADHEPCYRRIFVLCRDSHLLS